MQVKFLHESRCSGPLEPLAPGSDVIGLTVERAIIAAYVTAADVRWGNLPGGVLLMLRTGHAQSSPGHASMGAARVWWVPVQRVDRVPTAPAVYQIALSMTDLEPLSCPDDSRTVAVVRRPGATSDRQFLSHLGWTQKGIATLPAVSGACQANTPPAGPDALALLQAGGVEMLRATVIGPANLVLPCTEETALLRSPANVVYYSGHARLVDNCLCLDASGAAEASWAFAEDLVEPWRSSNRPSIFIIAACSVLGIHFDKQFTVGPGLRWSRLLKRNGGSSGCNLGLW
jgi:hypothetical protein